MLGLIAVIGTAIESSWGGFYQNRSDFFLCEAFKKIKERIPPQTEPPNHLIQRALRKSHIEATLLIINDRIKEIEPQGWKRISQKLVKPDSSNQSNLSIWAEKFWEQLSPDDKSAKTELLWLINVKDLLTKERNDVDKTNHPLKISTEYELFMSPTGETVKERVAEIRKKMADELLEELERISKFGGNLLSSKEAPLRVKEMITDGWFPYQQNRIYQSDDEKIHWFDCFCGFFQEKLSGKVGDVFQNRLLTNLVIGKDVPPELREGNNVENALTFDVFDAKLKTFSVEIHNRFDQIDLRFDAVDENFEIVKNLLLEVLEILKNKKPDLPNSIPNIVGFVGREDCLKEIRRKYQNGTRIFVFHGIGGVGKSALALAFASEIKEEHQAKIFVDMQGFNENPLSARDAMFDILVREFKTEIPPDTPDSQLLKAFNSIVQNQPTLIVLDNAENINSVESLTNADNACFIITSRKRIYLDEEPFVILKMSKADAVKLLSDKGGDKRFGEFTNEFAEECGYLPQALKVIKGLIMTKRLLRVDDFLEKFKAEKLKYLDEVMASLNLSYEIIGDELQTLWRKLAVFPAYFDSAACAAVWNIDVETAETKLDELDSYSLIEVNLETRRFNLHDLAREFCDSKLSEEEHFDIQFSFADYYEQILWEAQKIKESGGKSSIIDALRLIDTEWNNILAGQKWTAENFEYNDKIAKICRNYSGAFPNIHLRLTPQVYMTWMEDAVKACEKIYDYQGIANYLGNLGTAYLHCR